MYALTAEVKKVALDFDIKKMYRGARSKNLTFLSFVVWQVLSSLWSA
jgi:hypothetical protein